MTWFNWQVRNLLNPSPHWQNWKKTERECLCYGKPLASFLCTFQRLRSIDNTAIFVLWRKDFKKSLTLVCGTKFTYRHMLTGGLPAPHVPVCVKIFLPPTSASWNSYSATNKSETNYHFQLLQYHDQRLHCVGKMKEDDPVPSNFSISYWILLFQHKELLLTKYRK